MFSFKNIYHCYLACRKHKRNSANQYYLLVRKRVVNNYKIKKARYLNEYERQKGNMSLEEIKAFLPVQASFVGHIKHANSYNLKQKIGELNDEKTINLMFTHWRTQR